jgi:hypothetical protein
MRAPGVVSALLRRPSCALLAYAVLALVSLGSAVTLLGVLGVWAASAGQRGQSEG